MTDIDFDRRGRYTHRWLREKQVLPTSNDHPAAGALLRSLSRGYRVVDHPKLLVSEAGLVLLTSPYVSPNGDLTDRVRNLTENATRAARDNGLVVAVGEPGTGLYARQADVSYRQGVREAPSWLKTNVPVAFVQPFPGCRKVALKVARRLVRDLVPMEEEMRPDRAEVA